MWSTCRFVEGSWNAQRGGGLALAIAAREGSTASVKIWAFRFPGRWTGQAAGRIPSKGPSSLHVFLGETAGGGSFRLQPPAQAPGAPERPAQSESEAPLSCHVSCFFMLLLSAVCIVLHQDSRRCLNAAPRFSVILMGQERAQVRKATKKPAAAVRKMPGSRWYYGTKPRMFDLCRLRWHAAVGRHANDFGELLFGKL